MYLISFYVPQNYKEEVKEALFKKGAGKYSHYHRCSWEVLGDGQFEPMEGSHPFMGTKEKLEKVKEYRVEIICNDDIIKEVLDELIRVHPYEEPAYYAIKVEK